MALWEEVTSTSYVVDCEAVRDASKTASYVTKYISKAFGDREALARLGFSRRYSLSRRFPRVEPLQLAQTAAEGWDRVTMVSRDYLKAVYPEINDLVGKGGDVVSRIGESLDEALNGPLEQRALKKALGRMGHDTGQ